MHSISLFVSAIAKERGHWKALSLKVAMANAQESKFPNSEME
jgi:hypothetical protein